MSGGGGKTLNYLAVAIFALAVAQTAQAANCYWAGGTSSDWGTVANWTTGNKVPDNDGAYFRSDKFTSTFTNNNLTVTFGAAKSNNWRTYFNNCGSAAKPIVLRSTGDASYGLTSGDATSTDFEGIYIGTAYKHGTADKDTNAGEGDAYVRFETGTFKTGSYSCWYIGNETYAGHVVAVGSTLQSGHLFYLYNGSIFATNTTLTISTANCYFGDLANKTTSVVKNGGTWTLSKQWKLGSASGASASFFQDGGSITVTDFANLGSLNGGSGFFTNKAGNVTFSSKTSLGGNGGNCIFVMDGGTLNFNRSDDDADGSLSAGYGGGSGDTYFHHNGGTTTVAGNMNIVRDGSCEFNMNGGTVTVGRKTVFGSHNLNGSEFGRLNLNGGVFATPYLNYHNGGVAANVRFNGGTLKISGDGAMARGDKISGGTDYSAVANLEGVLLFKVAAGGGTIDTDGHSVTMPLAIAEDSSSTGGGMTFKGGGDITLEGAIGWTGGTTVEIGTCVKVADDAAADALIGSALVLAAPGAYRSGVNPLVTITGSGTFDASDAAKVTGLPSGTSVGISGDGKTIYVFVPAALCNVVLNQSQAQLVFDGATLADLATHTLRARFQGEDFSATGTEATFFGRTEYKDGDTLTNVTYQLQALDDTSSDHYAKAAKVEFTEGEGGVYAKLVDGNFANYGAQNAFGTYPLESNPGTGYYIPYDLRLVTPVSSSINVNFTNGTDLDTTSSVRYGAGDYAVPYTAWTNMTASGSTPKTIGGVVFTVIGQQGQYGCNNLNGAKDVRRGYIDDSASKATPTVTAVGVPYEFYRVVVYMSGDGGNKQYGYLTVNGVNYTASGTDALASDTVTTVTGTSAWGKTNGGTGGNLYGLKEGLNYLVSPATRGSTATIVANRISGNARANIAAIQIVEYTPETYTATISAAGTQSLSALAWDKTLPASLAAAKLVVNVEEDATLDIDSAVSALGVEFNVADGKTLTLSGSAVAADVIGVKGAGKVISGGASQLSGVLRGDGTLVYDGFKPTGATFTDAQWTGTVWVKNIATDSNERKDWTLANYGNAGSTIRFTNVNLYFATGTTSFAGTVDLDGDGMNVCDGYGGSITTIARLTGTGTLSTGGGSANGNGLTINDISAFTGTLTLTKYKVIVGTATGTSASGVLQIDSGKTATIAAGKTWTAPGGMTVNGTLNLGAGATASAVVSGTGTVSVASGTGTINGYSTAAALTLATAPGATLAISDGTLASMTVAAFNNLGTIDLTGTALSELTLTLAAGVKSATPGTILYPDTFRKFVAIPADQSIRSLEGFTAPTLPEGAAYYVQVAETNEEYGKASLTVTDAAAGVNVRVVRADETVTDMLSDAGTATLAGDVHIDGAATLYDITFKNNGSDGKTGGHFTYKGVSSGSLNYDSVPTFNNAAFDDTTGVYIKHHPYIEYAHSVFSSLTDFTAVVVGQMSPTLSTEFIHFGSSNGSRQGLLIATTDEANEVVIAATNGGTVDDANGVKVKIPNAASARHAYVVMKRGSVFTVYVDGIRRGTFTVSEGFALGDSGHSGMQVGSDFGAGIYKNTGNSYNNVQDSETETGVVNVIRVFDYAISEAQAEAVVAAYPYESQGGLYTRTVAADGTFSETDAWEKGGDDYDVPAGATVGEVLYNPSATLDVDAAATLTVNADVTIDTLTVGGEAALTFAADGAHAVTVVGAAVFNSPVTNEYGALSLAGTPVQLGSNGSLCFDCSGLDVSGVYLETRFQLTGLIDRDDAKVTLVPPADPRWTYALAYNTTGSCYDLVVTPYRGVWTGLGEDGEFGNTANWEDGIVPSAGDNLNFSALTTNATIAVTGASAAATFGMVTMGDAVVTFTGTFAAATFSDPSKVAVGASGSVVSAGQTFSASGSLFCANGGELAVTTMKHTGNGDRYTTEQQPNSVPAVFKFNSVTNSMTGNWLYFCDKNSASTNTFYIGAGGLNFLDESGAAAYCLGRNTAGDAQTIRPWNSDFTIAARSTDVYGLVLQRDITFYTDDESGTGRTITINAKTRANGSAVTITVTGSGTLKVNNGCNNNGTAPAVTVKDTATLSFGAEANLGASAIVIASTGATVVVADGATAPAPTSGVAGYDVWTSTSGGVTTYSLVSATTDTPEPVSYGEEGEETTINVPRGWAKSHGVTSAAGLAGTGENGLKYVESYALGLDPNRADAKPMADVEMSGGNIEFSLANVAVPAGVALKVKVVSTTAIGDDFTDIDGSDELTITGGDAGPSGTISIPLNQTEPLRFYRLSISISGTTP